MCRTVAPLGLPGLCRYFGKEEPAQVQVDEQMAIINTTEHPINESDYAIQCRNELAARGVLVLRGLVSDDAISRIVQENAGRERDAFFAATTHNVFLTPVDPALPNDHPFNRQVRSSKGLIADDQISADSLLRDIYADIDLRKFISRVLGVEETYPYADDLSSINVHFAPDGTELGWHFDNSAFALTMLLQAPEGGGVFEYVPNARNADEPNDENAYEIVGSVLDGTAPVEVLSFDPGDLVVFRGRNALHRVTPTTGATTRLLVVFAFNERPGVRLSDSALATFYGRPGR